MSDFDFPIAGSPDELDNLLNSTLSSSDHRNDRGRPYDGQPQTFEGVRGSALVQGLTVRDIIDCYVKALHLSTGEPRFVELVEKGKWRTNGVYDIHLDNLDPIAVAQNLMCELEKMQGTYPNLPHRAK